MPQAAAANASRIVRAVRGLPKHTRRTRCGCNEVDPAVLRPVARRVRVDEAQLLRRRRAERHLADGHPGRCTIRVVAERARPTACASSSLICPKCTGVRRVLAEIHDPASIAWVLGAMRLSSAVPEQVGCPAPPAGEEFGSDSECVAD